MPTTLTVNSSFSGKQTLPYFHAAFLSLTSLSNGMFKVMTNIEGSANVPTINLSGDLVVDHTCDFAPVGTIAIAERKLTPELFDIPKQICKSDFLNDYEVQSMLPGAKLNQPKNAVDAIIIAMLGQSMATLEKKLYSGVNATAGEFDGVETLLAVDAALPADQEVTGTAVNAGNVATEIGKVIDATPDALRDQADFHIGVASNVFYAAVRALGIGAAGVGSPNGVDNKSATWYDGHSDIMWEGIRLVRCAGMTSDVMIASTTENFWFGTSLMSDLQSISTLDMFPVDLSRNIRFLGTYFAAVQYGSAVQVVTYGIVNTAN